MASVEFNNVKAEKANALRRYHKRQRLQNMLRLFNIGAALFVFSRSSWFSVAVDVISHLYSKFALLFNSTFSMFLLGNVIILVIYALSDHGGGKTGGQSDIYEDFRNNSESRLKVSAYGRSPSAANNIEEGSPETQMLTLNSSEDYTPEKEITRSEPVESPAFEKTVTAVTDTRTRTTTTTTCCTTVSMTTKGEKVSERKCYRRVQSESFERRIVVGRRRELNRVTSEVAREPERRICSVEELTNEEFNRTVEDFIAKHKRKQREEHKGSQKTEYLTLTQ
ncbi:hypothetical protein L6164_015336 [Bauhinia variegata]|uniref:Uncharacterized protein n=1 Tax=Bauhinia variegata TaxID=167791 RepID=A0ACB9NMB6_BAUVA|nr:hypothetical protein L6164_015336 [Bauhinia variegata]